MNWSQEALKPDFACQKCYLNATERMDPLEEPYMQKVIRQTWPTAEWTAKPNIHNTKVMLCIWCDQKGVLYYKLIDQLFRMMQNTLTRLRITSEQNIKNLFWFIDSSEQSVKHLFWFIDSFLAAKLADGLFPYFGMDSIIAKKMGKSYGFTWAILWIILLYIFFLK